MIEIYARVLKIGEVVTGTSKTGNPYKRCDVTFAHSQRLNQQTGQQEFETIMMTVFNDKVDALMQLPQGQLLSVKFFSNVRESEKQPGRFYNDFSLWQAVPFQQMQKQMPQQPQYQQMQPQMYAPQQMPMMQQPQQTPFVPPMQPQFGQPQSVPTAPQGQGYAQANNGATTGTPDMPF